MAFQKVEFEFPEHEETTNWLLKILSAVEIDILARKLQKISQQIGPEP